MIKIGTLITSKYSTDIEMIVSVDDSGTIPVYEAKWVNSDGSLSEGSAFIFGSQIDNYNIVDEHTEISNEEIKGLEKFIENYKVNVKRKNNGIFPRFAQVYISRYERYLNILKDRQQAIAAIKADL